MYQFSYNQAGTEIGNLCQEIKWANIGDVDAINEGAKIMIQPSMQYVYSKSTVDPIIIIVSNLNDRKVLVFCFWSTNF